MCAVLGALGLDASEPVAVRARADLAFHFGGERPTNRDDKPEWVYAVSCCCDSIDMLLLLTHSPLARSR